jgi:hypothetical protein
MRLMLITIAVISAVLSSGGLYGSSSGAAEAIMERNYYASKLLEVQQTVEMRLVNNRNEVRERKLDVMSALQDNGIDSNMLVRFQEPADVRGTAFLQLENSEAEDDLWIYLPALFKSRRLVASNKKDSFIGSDFAYGDMLPPKVALYSYKAAGEDSSNGFDCYVIEATPATDKVLKDYGYSRKKMWIHKESFHEVKVEYYDSRGDLLKVQNVKELKLIDADNSRWLATVRSMENRQTGHATLIEVVDYTTDVDYSRRTFSKRNLERF